MAKPGEFLKSLTAEQLNRVVDEDFESVNTPDSATIVKLVAEDYPELLSFAQDSVDRLPLPEGTSTFMYLLPLVTVLGAICRVAEIEDMPTLS